MASTVLVITDASDAHADAVIVELKALGAEVFRFHPSDYPREIELSMELKGGVLHGSIQTAHRRLDLNNVSAAWYRRPGDPQPDPTLDRGAVEYTQLQARRSLWGLYSCLDVHWVCNPLRLRVAEIKPLQLIVAAQVGLDTPATLISNSPSSIGTFLDDLDGECAVKPLEVVGVSTAEGYRFPLTARLPPGQSLASARVAPTIYQPFIPKKTEVRIVVVGEEIVCADIERADDERSRSDWRAGNARFRAGRDIPRKVATGLLELLRRFDVNFASIDMIVTPDDRYVFLELNPNGQWLWLQHELGIPLSRRIADLLLRHGRVLSGLLPDAS